MSACVKMRETTERERGVSLGHELTSAWPARDVLIDSMASERTTTRIGRTDMRGFSALVVCLMFLSAGCARVKITHVDNSDTSPGVHFYEPRPYLLVSVQKKKDDKGVEHNEFSSQIIWLPDPTRRYVVQVEPGWGTVDGSVKLTNGWMLTELGAKSDSKIPETITAISGLVKEAAALADQPQQGLYRIDIGSDGTVTLVRQIGWK
jgi:hypothetical protein